MRSPALTSRRRRGLAGAVAAALVVSPLAAALSSPAEAVSPNVVISEAYGGGGNSGAAFDRDYVELYNPTASTVSLSGLSLQGRAATGGSAGTLVELTGSITAGGTYVVATSPSGANGAALPSSPAQTATWQLGATGGQVLLVTGNSAYSGSGNLAGSAGLVDMVGWGTTGSGNAATGYETAAGAVTTSATAILRTKADADNNSDEFAAATPTPGTAPSFTSGPSALALADPGPQSSTVGTAISPLSLSASGGSSPYTFSATSLPDGLTLNPSTGVITGTPTTAGTPTVTVTVTDNVSATNSKTLTWTVAAAEGPITIAQVQGTGPVSPRVGTTVTTRGIVTAAYPSGGFFGFYIQTPGTGAANIDLSTHTASDGVFVRQTSGSVTTTPGTYVEVTGTVAEFAGATQINVAPAGITALGGTVAPAVTTTTSSWPRTAAQKESLEGMRYRPTGHFTVSNTFVTNNFGEVGLAQGKKPLIQRTEVELPGPAASSPTEADNIARAIVLDDGASTNFLATSSDAAVCGARPTPCLSNGNLTPPYISATAPVIVGARVRFKADVIFTEGGSPSAPTYRFQPLATVVGPGNAGAPATFENTRTAAPDEALINKVGRADLKVASFNVLNYFTTLGDANDDNIGDGGCTAFRDRDGDGNSVNSGCEQRGAWDPQDLARQQTKIVAAINALDADVVGLLEIENSKTLGETPDEATSTLVAALNADAGAGTWAVNPSSTELPASGMDVITNAIIYKPASVDRVGPSRALGTLSDAGEAFDNAREPLAQVFRPDRGGTPFLFVVNHFKSKGSAGPNPGDADSGDGQSASNGSRKLQAAALRDWVAGVRTGAKVDSVVLAGDFNSYSMEDPLRILYDAGYTNVAQRFAKGKYSYSFSGLAGSLDHILVNGPALKRSTGGDVWDINGGEALALEYSRYNYHGTDFYASGPYRSSDHDPVILGLARKAKVKSSGKDR